MPKTLTTVADRIRHLAPCGEALAWAKDYTSPQKAWEACQRGDWMLWILGRTTTSEPWTDDRKPLLACALDCAETVKHLWPEKQAGKITEGISVLRRWIGGEATTEEAQKARRQLYAAAYAATATDAAYAAYAATAATAAAATDAAAVADAAADAADAAYAAREKIRSECAAIVRRHFPKPPVIRQKKG